MAQGRREGDRKAEMDGRMTVDTHALCASSGQNYTSVLWRCACGCLGIERRREPMSKAKGKDSSTESRKDGNKRLRDARASVRVQVRAGRQF